MVLAARVSLRYQAKTGGIFAAPPGLYQSILEWSYAIVAANAKQSIEGAIASLRERYNNPDDGLVKLEKALDALEAKPDWKTYVAVYEASWVFGHPGARWTVKDFQKLTPEKKAKLNENIAGLVSYLRKRIASERDQRVEYARGMEKELDGLHRYLLPGVDAMSGNEVRKDFALDLTGWVYAQRYNIEQMVKERAQEDAKRLRDVIERAPNQDSGVALDLKKVLDDMAEKPLGEWQVIRVILTKEQIKGARAYWDGISKIIKVTIPPEARPSDLEDLGKSLRHELQHLGQSLLTFAVKGLGSGSLGKPSKNIRTPEFQQRFDPRHPFYNPQNPDAQKLVQKLKDQGINPKSVNFHSLDDIEFYTNLADAVDDFKRAWDRAQRQGTGDLSTAVKLYTGVIQAPSESYSREDSRMKWLQEMGGYEFVRYFDPNPFFLTLKKHAPGKWRKAVSELFKAAS